MLKLVRSNRGFILLLPVILLFLLLSAEESIPYQREVQIYRNKGLEFQRQERLDEAMVCFQKAIALDPDFVVAYNDLGIIYEAKGWLDKAEKVYLAGLEIDPSYPNLYSNLAMLYEQKQDYKRAASFWKKRIELGIPGDVWTEEAIGRLGALRRTSPALREEYVKEEARQLAREISLKKRIERLGNIEEADRLYEQAKTLYQNGEYEEALNIIGLGLSLNPENKEEFLRIKNEINYRLIEQKERFTLPRRRSF